MKKLEAEKQFKPTEQKVKAILENFGLTFLRFKELEKGLENVSLKVTTREGVFVLRVLRRDKKSDTKLLQELDYMAYLREAKLPVPQTFTTNGEKEFLIYQDSSGFSFRCVLMEFMKGIHIQKYSKPALRNLAKVVSKLETLGERYGRQKGMKAKASYKYYIFKPDVSLKITKPELKDFFRRSLLYKAQIAGANHVGFHHVDLDHRNILFSGNTVSAILDFDDCMHTTTVHDLAALVEDIIGTNNNTKDADYFIAAYKKYKNLGTDMKHLKRLVHIFNFFYSKVEIELWGEKTSKLPYLLKLERLIDAWDN